MTQSKPLLSIVVPVYNEGENIKTLLLAIKKSVKHDFRILIVYDFDEDDTLSAVNDIKNIVPEIELVKNKYGNGALNAIKTGLERVETEYALVTMADMSDEPESINKMLDTAVKNDSAIVCASRYMKGGAQIGGPFIKGVMSRTACLIMHYFAGVPSHDATNSFKLYSKSFLDSVKIESNGGFELGLELVVKAYSEGLNISEIPTTWHDRAKGKSRFKIIAWLPSYLKWFFKSFSVGFKRFLSEVRTIENATL